MISWRNIIQQSYNAIIIGGGAAGLFCGAMLQTLPNVLLLEKTDSLGKKLLLSGNGQCNFTHAGEMRDFYSHYGGQYLKIVNLLMI